MPSLRIRQQKKRRKINFEMNAQHIWLYEKIICIRRKSSTPCSRISPSHAQAITLSINDDSSVSESAPTATIVKLNLCGYQISGHTANIDIPFTAVTVYVCMFIYVPFK